MTTSNFRSGDRPAIQQPSASSGFFAHHGVWAPGVRLFRALGFSTKALIISLALVLPLLGLVVWQLDHQASEAMKARKDATRQHVEIAHGVLVMAQKQEASGKLSRAEAQALAKETIASLRYEGSEYFWINDMQPRFLELMRKHAEFHEVAAGVARRINSGAMAEAERLIGSGSRFAGVSTEVCTLLTQAKRGW